MSETVSKTLKAAQICAEVKVIMPGVANVEMFVDLGELDLEGLWERGARKKCARLLAQRLTERMVCILEMPKWAR